MGAPEPVQQWTFEAQAIHNGTLKATVGGLTGEVRGDIAIKNEGKLSWIELAPTTNPTDGGILLADTHEQAQLPREAMTVEAWVQIDKDMPWGGILGAVYDTGATEFGWILGYGNKQFNFGLVAEKPGSISYLRSRQQFRTGTWYYVAATYDGKVMKLYLNGRLSALHHGRSGPILQPKEPFHYIIGSYRDDNDNRPLTGKLERITVWHTALTEQVIADRYTARHASFKLPPLSKPQASSDWPTWQGDNARSGQSKAKLALPFQSQPTWVHHPRQAPAPAWPETAQSDYWRNRSTPETPRVTFDWCHDVVAANGLAYYGSSADDALRCLDLETGKERWQFLAGGPIRLAPTVHDNQVLFGCDDGFVYALDAKSGALQWKTKPPSTSTQYLPGNSRLISLWPVRTGVLVKDNVAHFGAGLFPGLGTWQCQADLKDGSILEELRLSVSPQGYLTEENGKVVPRTGRGTGRSANSSADHRTNAPPLSPARLKSYSLSSALCDGYLFAGGPKSVAAFRISDQKKIWEATVDAPARGLAIASGRLLVSTKSGRIYCFSDQAPASKQESQQAVTPAPQTKLVTNLLADLPHPRGYALVIGLNDGATVRELANRSQMHVVAVDTDPKRVERIRTHLHADGCYGRNRDHTEGSAAIQWVANLDQLPYVDGLFNLVLSERTDLTLPVTEQRRLLHPNGFSVFAGQRMKGSPIAPQSGWTHLYGDPGNSSTNHGAPFPKGPLRPQWFGPPGPHHMVDRHLRAPSPVCENGYLIIPGRNYLIGVDAFNGTVLWERPVEQFTRVAALRDSGSITLASDGTVYAASGPHCLELDPSNGKQRRRLTVKVDTHEWGYLGIPSEDSFLIGSTVPKGAIRRSLAKVSIFGGGYGDRQRVVCSDSLFAIDRETGKRSWSYRPRGAIPNPSLSLSKNSCFFLECQDEKTLGEGSADGDYANKEKDAATKIRGRWHYDDLAARKLELVALDVETGKEQWRKPLTIPADTQALYLSCRKDHLVLVFSYNAQANPTAKNKTLHYQTRVFSAGGSPLWTESFDTGRRMNLIHGEQDLHPVITDEMLVVEPKVYDLASGELLFTFQRKGGGCGALSATNGRLFFRAGNPATFDLRKREQHKISQVSRPGCWINMIPAHGLLLIPEGSSGCICNYPIQASMAFRPVIEPLQESP